MQKLKYGIIGTGDIARNKHLPGYAALPGVELYAACDINAEKLEAMGKAYAIPRLFESYKDLLALPEIDLVSVCLPNYLHAPATVEALNAGKHVHCEKPMAMNAREASDMLAARDKTGKKLMIGLNNRFLPEAHYVKKYIDGGHLGRIYYAKCGWLRRRGLPANPWFQDKELSGGGALIDLGVHYIDLVMYMLGYPKPLSVTAGATCNFGGGEEAELYGYEGHKKEWKCDIEDHIAGFIRLENNVNVSFEINWASNMEKEIVFYEIYGTKANIKYGPGGVTIFTNVNGQFADITPQIEPRFAGAETNEFQYFVDCINNGVQPVISNSDQCREMMRLVDGIYKSAETFKEHTF